MFKKIGVTVLLAGLAFFALPSAANADYVPDNSGGSGAAQKAPGSSEEVTFAEGIFKTGGESVLVTVDGSPTPTLVEAVIKSRVSQTFRSDANGALHFKIVIPKEATDASVYTITATGVESGSVGNFVITVATADTGAGASLLTVTGGTIPTLAIWGGAGLLLLGGALFTVNRLGRRSSIKI